MAAAEWTLVYHAGPFKGRAEPLRLLLEDAGVAFETQNEPIHGPEGHMDAFRGSPEAVKADLSPYPVMFPPVIWHRPKDGEEVYVNQTAACLSYIGGQVGYDPQNAAERARADMIIQNCTDFVSEGRGSFHPVNPKGPYKEQQEAADKASKIFTESRLLIWLQHFEKLLKRTGGAKPVAGGPKVTYADFMLFHALDAARAQFNTDFYEKAWDKADIPVAKAYHAWMESRPKLQAYFASDRRNPWSGDSMM
mmetsp:Transcript_26502/g.87900  ORF Transcript_26502/g.87900 Transcript_26502/m.87900 type:complete len:250 (+) Transcript_26502:77-826(+)